MTETVRIDLHSHSSASDGDHSPSHVAKRLADIGVVWAALTDHNTVAGQEEFRTALGRYGIGYTAGVEVDARSRFGPLHILGYGIDLDDPILLSALRNLRQPLRASMRHWRGRIRSLYGEPPRDDAPCAPTGANGGAPRGPLTTGGAICLIHAAGGLALLAHPLESLGSFKRLEEALDVLQPEGVDGLEVFHRSYPEGVRSALLALTVRRGLIPTGGSDFHGLHHSDGASLGVDVPAEQWAHMRKYLAKNRGPTSSMAPRANTTS